MTTTRRTTRTTTTTRRTSPPPNPEPRPDEPFVVLGLGSNLGQSAAQLEAAIAALERLLGPLVVAPLYRTAPLSTIPQRPFLNTVALARWTPSIPSPEELLAAAKALERQAGRDPGAPRDAPRPLDVDLLLVGDLVLRRPGLTLPHPRLRQRRFVLAPLADVAPHLRLPPEGLPVAAALAALDEAQVVERVGWPGAGRANETLAVASDLIPPRDCCGLRRRR